MSCLRPRPPSVRNNGEALSAPIAGGGDVGVEIVFQQVVRRHFVLLAAFLVQPHPPAFALRIVVLDVHVQRRRDAGEGVDQQRDQRPVAQARRSVETSMLSSSFFASSPSSTGVLPFLTTCFGPRTAAAGFGPRQPGRRSASRTACGSPRGAA